MPCPFLQADVGLESRHEFDPPNVAPSFWTVQCAEAPCKTGCINTSYVARFQLERQSLESCISSITNIVLAMSAAAGAIIAGLGLRTWRRELHGRADFDMARHVMLGVYQLRNELRHVRSVFSPDSLDTQYERLNDKASELDIVLLEAEVLWGDKLHAAKRTLKDSITSWRNQLRRYFRTINTSDELSEKDTEKMDAILCGDEDDEFGKGVQKAVVEFETALRPYLKRKNASKAT